jgi:very-short-patch-repair endonuclease
MPGNSVDRLIAALAERQHGVVSRKDLLETGVSRHAIAHRLREGRLHRLHRSVYAVGHRVLTADGRRIAARLAAGPGAVLSHRSAAAHWELRSSPALEVTVGTGGRRSLPGVTVHYLPLESDEVTTERAIRVTTVPRTLFDLAAVLPKHQVERAINEAEVRGMTDLLSLGDLVERYPHRWGVAGVREILARLRFGLNIARSELESRFLALLDEAGLPRPEMNAQVPLADRWIECDCLWRGRRVVVELDGRATHDTSAAFERDRARDRMLSARGWRVVRITWRQLKADPEAVLVDLTNMLERGFAFHQR